MIKFPYLLWRGRYCPIIEVELQNKNRRVRTPAYLDTGATYSVFHSDFCEELGIEMLTGKRVDIAVGDGGFIPVYVHNLTIVIGKLKFAGKIGFSDRLGIGINILGRESVLDDYLICFNGIKREILWHI